LSGLPLKIRSGAAMTVVLAAPGYPAAPVLGQSIRLGPAQPDSQLFHAGTKTGSKGVEVAGGRVLAATGWGKDLGTARERAYALAAEVSFAGMQVRRDIGHRALGAGK
jgi:phosphoribosylamine--glycine ligase